jgi:ApaG protein
MYTSTTKNISVTVEPRYMADRSDPSEQRFFWAYTVEIANSGSAAVQILARHWIITDANGKREDVRGIGVVGEQPVIEPGHAFDYVSGCPLNTPSGAMEGRYHMVGADGGGFAVAIPRFPLIAPAVTS